MADDVTTVLGDVYKIRIANNTYYVLDSNTRDSIAEEYKTNKQYYVDDFCFHGDTLMQCKANTYGEFDGSKWSDVTALGGLANILGETIIHAGGMSEQQVELDFVEADSTYRGLTGDEQSGGQYISAKTPPFLWKEGFCLKFDALDEYNVQISRKADYPGAWDYSYSFDDEGYVYVLPYGDLSSDSVWLKFSRKDGGAMNLDYGTSTSDAWTISNNLSLYFRVVSPQNNSDKIRFNITGEYTEIVHNSNEDSWDEPLELYEERPEYRLIESTQSLYDYDGWSWTQWQETDSGILIYFKYDGDGYPYHRVDAVYKYYWADNEPRYVYASHPDTMELTREYPAFLHQNDSRYFEIPEAVMLSGYGGEDVQAKLVAYQIGFPTNTEVEQHKVMIIKKPASRSIQKL